MKRLIVYFHYDPLGQIDTACRVAVEAMAHYGEVFFISNGTLRPADRAWAASVTLTCRERENKGLDVGAYKEALAKATAETISSITSESAKTASVKTTATEATSSKTT